VEGHCLASECRAHTEYSKLDDVPRGRFIRWLKLLQVVPANCPAEHVRVSKTQNVCLKRVAPKTLV
jgi:hypothetical protein